MAQKSYQHVRELSEESNGSDVTRKPLIGCFSVLGTSSWGDLICQQETWGVVGPFGPRACFSWGLWVPVDQRARLRTLFSPTGSWRNISWMSPSHQLLLYSKEGMLPFWTCWVQQSIFERDAPAPTFRCGKPVCVGYCFLVLSLLWSAVVASLCMQRMLPGWGKP